MKPKDCKPGIAVRIVLSGDEGIVIGNIIITGIIINGVRLLAVDVMTTKGHIARWSVRSLEKLRD